MTDTEVVVVGGGPAGAIAATLLARRGHEVVLLERTTRWRWRACGVFASPAALAHLARLGLDTPAVTAAARPIPAMRVESPGGASFRLTYGDDDRLAAPAVGIDRGTLDDALLAEAAAAGTDVRRGTNVVAVEPALRPRLRLRHDAEEGTRTLTARVVVGTDGLRSTVARSFGVVGRVRLAPRIGLTYHVADPRPADPHDARMIVLPDGAYCGLAPVPGGRVNVGIVLSGPSWRGRLAANGAAGVCDAILRAVPERDGEPGGWGDRQLCDRVAGAFPIGHRVRRRAGPGWILAGDAAGFLDPFTGEGLHRAFVSAELAARAVDASLAGRADAPGAYERSMTRRFGVKDLVSTIVQAFLARPALFEYAAGRLATRPAVRETMGLVIGDLVPASRALDPRFLGALLAP